MEPQATGRGFIYHVKGLAFHFLLGGAALVLLFNFNVVLEGDWSSVFKIWIFNGMLWVALGFGHGWIVDHLEEKMPWLEMPIKRLWVSLLLSLLYTVAVAVVIFVGFVSVAYGLSILKSIEELDEDYLLTVIIVTVIISLFLHGRGFFFSWKESILEAEKLKRAHLSAQYESLKNQVNPHFLFNSFNVLSSLVYKDQGLAAKFIEQLSQVYRYVLDTREKEVVPLSQELEMLEAYLFLLEMRFGEALQVEMALEADESAAVVPLALQMLVENAVKHNVVSRRRPLKLEIWREEDQIVVRNNFQPREDERESLGVGLPNIKERYRHLAGLKVEASQSNGSFTVCLPVITLQE